MFKNSDYEKASQAIENYKKGVYPDVVAAATDLDADMKIVNVMLGNESIITEDTFVENSTKENRLSICNSCDQFLSVSGGTCNQCACPISVIVNMKFKTCPLGKW